MILSDRTILKMLEEKTLVIDPVTKEQIQPASVDIRLGDTFSVVDDTPSGIITLDSKIDMAAGIIIEKKTGDRVEKGDVLATLYADDEKLFDKAEQKYKESLVMSDEAVKRNPLLYAKVSRDGIKYF